MRAGRSKGLAGLLRAIATRDEAGVAQLLHEDGSLAQAVFKPAQAGQVLFLKEIDRTVKAGDTALHIAAVVYSIEAARRLLAHGARVDAKNENGAQALHFAADGRPGAPGWKPAQQKNIIKFLIAAGARPDAQDKRGVTPLHRAVRMRCSKAVNALLSAGADPRLVNGKGSTPLHLAVQNTGVTGATTMAARYQQRQIIALLLKFGASADDVNGAGRSVRECAKGEWLAELLGDGGEAQRQPD